jgi:hypothetical protein
MKNIFFIGTIGLILFEIANIYFIMPMPGSQEMQSIDFAYFLDTWRWVFRGVFSILVLLGFQSAQNSNKWLTAFFIALPLGIAYLANFQMAADVMFYQPKNLQMSDTSKNLVSLDKLILGVTRNGYAKAYPIQQIGYHHQVLDTLGNEPIMVTYCTVCRTGRVYEPLVNGKKETFRLVGMDHFNAMFEDATTKSWWRQSNGVAITGVLKGQKLPELFSEQMTLKNWLQAYPNSLIMQPDTVSFGEEYKDMVRFESGKSKGKLTRMDSLSWNKKSWIVGVENDIASKAYDWNRLKKERVIQDKVGKTDILLIMASDTMSFFAFENPSPNAKYTLIKDTLHSENQIFNLHGIPLMNSSITKPLKKIQAYQEFWHSWETFHTSSTH